MGMFDDLIIDSKYLPDKLKGHIGGWQTKSYGSLFHVLVISETGRLLETTGLKNDTRVLKETNYTGEIRFYDEISGVWVEFNASFVDGQMVDLVQISPLSEADL